MMRLLVTPAGLAFIAVLTLFAGRAVIAIPPASDAVRPVCASVPAATGSVLDAGAATAEDLQAFHKSVESLRAELDRLCKRDKAVLKRFKSRAKSIVFEMSAGATEPTAYLKDGRLVIEFYGGPFDARSFRQMVTKVLKGQKIPDND
ncbi:MAG TPA: hypothetical protein DIC59_00835 [Candidatus Competibacteraceae bacterium]|nr:hypothetical protein [Candidatus Competibacteraceae bacterium]